MCLFLVTYVFGLGDLTKTKKNHIKKKFNYNLKGFIFTLLIVS